MVAMLSRCRERRRVGAEAKADGRWGGGQRDPSRTMACRRGAHAQDPGEML